MKGLLVVVCVVILACRIGGRLIELKQVEWAHPPAHVLSCDIPGHGIEFDPTVQSPLSSDITMTDLAAKYRDILEDWKGPDRGQWDVLYDHINTQFDTMSDGLKSQLNAMADEYQSRKHFLKQRRVSQWKLTHNDVLVNGHENRVFFYTVKDDGRHVILLLDIAGETLSFEIMGSGEGCSPQQVRHVFDLIIKSKTRP